MLLAKQKPFQLPLELFCPETNFPFSKKMKKKPLSCKNYFLEIFQAAYIFLWAERTQIYVMLQTFYHNFKVIWDFCIGMYFLNFWDMSMKQKTINESFPCIKPKIELLS